MATIKMGATISDARGSVGGTVFSRNGGGAYTRARVKGINPNSAKQSVVRANFGANSKMWSALLTPTQRAAWVLFAQANPVPNRLGDSIILSGLAMFNRLNQVLATIAEEPLLDAPSDLSVPTLATVDNVTAGTIAQQLQVETEAQTVVAGAQFYIFATGSLAPGRKPQDSQYRLMGAYAQTAMGTQIDFSAAWLAAFGAVISGASIGVKVATVNVDTGALTPALVFNIIAGA